MDETLTNRVDARAHATRHASILTVVLQADRLVASSSVHVLEGIDEVLLGRGNERSARREGRTLILQFEDRWASSKHARLRRERDRFVLEDCGSKNGTFLSGARIDSPQVLPSGAVIEVGRTFLVHRDDATVSVDHALDGVASETAPMLASMSPELAASFAVLGDVARSPLPVLVRGETGTGKEAIARAVHHLSHRRGAFVAVNCGALPANLVESELFGFKKGAFSGALADRAGLVRAADGGTLFLDEIGDLAPSAQAALLRVLQELEVMPLGATAPVKVDLHVVAATHRELDAASFRPDLLARLSGFVVRLPPLRDRREDIGLIVRAILARHAPGQQPELTHAAARALFRHSFPHNVRELDHVLAAAIVIAHGQPLELELTTVEPVATTLDDEDRARRDEIVRLLNEHGGNISAVARAMGKARMQIQRWMKRYGLER